MSVESKFIDALTKAFNIIKETEIEYEKFGIFGSFARNEITPNSDIDFVLVVRELPSRMEIAMLRDKFDDIDCDIAFLLSSSFNNPVTAFAKNVVRDFKEIKLWVRLITM